VRKLFTGVCTALVTPFRRGRVDFDALGKLVRRQIAAGVDAICVLGTTGEAPTLSMDEKCAIIKFTNTIVNGRIPVVFGIGGNNPADIIELGKFVRTTCRGGRIGVMVSAPYYNKCTQSGAVRFFRTIANAVKLPLVVYNVPGRAGVNLEPATIAAIARNKYVTGIKEASGDMTQIAETVRLCRAAVYCGDDALALPCYAVGCQGVISVASNIKPREVRRIWLLRKNMAGRRLYLAQLPFYRDLFTQVNPIPVKHMLWALGLIQNELRLPLTEMR